MAGGGGGLEAPQRVKRGKHSKRKKLKRIGFKLDMTPLVDITFLLLTFFMFTTTMLKPQIMEMRVPPQEQEIEVAPSKLLTIMVLADGKIFWYPGLPEENKPELVEINKLRVLAEQQNLKPIAKNELITSLKIAEETKYETVIQILDELNLAEIAITEAVSKEMGPDGQPKKRNRKFSMSVLTEKDLKLVEGL